ncbi:MAG: glycosyltransferase family 39 protein [Ilumatobacteraceae bacterium]
MTSDLVPIVEDPTVPVDPSPPYGQTAPGSTPSGPPNDPAPSAAAGPSNSSTMTVTAPSEQLRPWNRAVAIGICAFVVSRLCVLAGAGVRASQVTVDANIDLEPRPGTPLGLVTGVFTQWDGLWYLEIVRSGYPRSIPPDITYFQLEARAAFFPLYPMLVRALDPIIPGGDTIAALFVNFVLSIGAVVLVGVLARRLFDTDVAERAMVLFAVFPGSFVLSYAYAEALLIVLAALCLWFLLDDRWLLAGVAAALATATRPNGIALVAACAVAAFIAIYRRRDWSSLIAPLLAPVGFVAFQLFLAAHTGESRPWFRVQREAWREGTSFGATAVSNTLSFISHPLASPTDALTAVSMAALVIGLWCLWRKRLPWPMIAYIAVIVALMLLPSTVTARPRFLLTAFPLFISAAAWWPRRDRAIWDLMLVACGAGLVALTTIYGVFGAIP